ncbi:hypothetical protein RN001_001794 [Aquatica leii]|uniref:Uncharacterized protein n=1 Tax=Aquatica leii TaxID=1421715 RepID=A0AAN7SR10_9COLE|nr:hypothetical protein RN001_001794 [Aquatica leii]
MANENIQDYVTISTITLLKRKRGAVKHKLTCFKTYLNDIDVKFVNSEQLSPKCIAELKIRTDTFELINNEFEQIQNDIELVCLDNELEIQYNERSSFFDNYVSLLANARNILKGSDDGGSSVEGRRSSGCSSVGSGRSNVDQSSFQIHGVKLAFIDLPKFNGLMKANGDIDLDLGLDVVTFIPKRLGIKCIKNHKHELDKCEKSYETIPQEHLKEWGEVIKSINDVCIESNKTDKKLIKEMLGELKYSEDKALKCYWRCLHEKLGLFKPNGDIDLDLVLKVVTFIPKELGIKCIENQKHEMDKCEKSYKLAKCVIDEISV